MNRYRMKANVHKFIYNVCGEKINSKLSNIRLYITDFAGREHFKRFGQLNGDKKIYLIRRKLGVDEGLLSVFTYVMGRIDYADRNNLIPFVDIDSEKYPSMFTRYFVLKTDISKSEVYQSKNVLLSGYGCKQVYPGWCNWINTEFNEQKRKLFDKYIEFTDEINESVNYELQHINPDECLGLFLRGYGYINTKPGGHPIQPDFCDVKDQIDEILEKENLSKIFLVTEDIDMFNKVKDCYGDKVQTICRDRMSSKGSFSGTKLTNAQIEENNIVYLTKIILLSMCHSFVGGRTNGSSVANALNAGKYKRRFIYDVGYYK